MQTCKYNRILTLLPLAATPSSRRLQLGRPRPSGADRGGRTLAHRRSNPFDASHRRSGDRAGGRVRLAIPRLEHPLAYCSHSAGHRPNATSLVFVGSRMSPGVHTERPEPEERPCDSGNTTQSHRCTPTVGLAPQVGAWPPLEPQVEHINRGTDLLTSAASSRRGDHVINPEPNSVPDLR
jgi:hypothetical protein